PLPEPVKSIFDCLEDAVDGLGIIDLASDGVLRSLTADRDIVDAVGLTPDQITAILAVLPGDPEKFKDADGSKLTREEWYKPDKSILPAPLSEDDRVEARKLQEENVELFQKKDEEMREK
ncbi:hypothetical protein EJ08DRAFT_557720, partial [Tothia fuscella]